MVAVVFSDQEMSAAKKPEGVDPPHTLAVAGWVLCFLKSMIISLVFLVLTVDHMSGE